MSALVSRDKCGSQWKSLFLYAVSYQVCFGKWPSVPLTTLRGGGTGDSLLTVCLFLRGALRAQASGTSRGSHPPGGRTCRRCCPGSCGSHCSSSSECLWPPRTVRRGHLALCSMSHSLFFSGAVASFSSGDCNQPPHTHPRRASKPARLKGWQQGTGQ